jgi:hypothetical protein
LHGKNGHLKRDVTTLFGILKRERLQRELKKNAEELHAAEKEGDDAALKRLDARARKLTGEIAKVTKEE